MDTNADKDDTDDSVVHQAQSSSLLVSATSISIAPHASLHGKILMDGHIALHSQQPTTTFASLGNSFCTWLVRWLANELAANDIILPFPTQFGPDDQVSH